MQNVDFYKMKLNFIMQGVKGIKRIKNIKNNKSIKFAMGQSAKTRAVKKPNGRANACC